MAEQSEQTKQKRAEIRRYYGIGRRNNGFIALEKIYKKILTPKPELISNDSDPLPRLQYFPEDIADLILSKKYVKKQIEENLHHDYNYPKRYNDLRQQIRIKIRQHAAVLKWFDILTKSEQSGDEKNHFSTSLDTDRVQSLIDYFKQNEGDPSFLLTVLVNKEYTTELGTGKELTDKTKNIHFCYFWYAVYAAYDDFLLAPPCYDDFLRTKKLQKMLRYMERREQEMRK